MKIAHRLALSFLALAVLLIYPPWIYVYRHDQPFVYNDKEEYLTLTDSAGYAFFFDPPDPIPPLVSVRLDYLLLFIELSFVVLLFGAVVALIKILRRRSPQEGEVP